jgi:hypothetical protein
VQRTGKFAGRKTEPVSRERNFAGIKLMDRETQFATDLQALRSLCDEAIPREERLSLMQSLSGHVFVEPEHQVVFESIRALFTRGPVSMAQLHVHLNNRGFPDTEVEKYFQPATSGGIPRPRNAKVTT